MRKLPVAKLILGSLVIPWHYRASILRSIWPLLIILLGVLSVFSTYVIPFHKSLGPFSVLLWVIIVAIAVYCQTTIAVIVHRAIILPAEPHTYAWGKREWHFLGYTVMIGVFQSFAEALVSVPIFLFGCLMLHSDCVLTEYKSFFKIIINIPVAYLVARFCLSFPSIAVDSKINAKSSWIETRPAAKSISFIVGYWPLALVTLISVLPSGPSIIGLAWEAPLYELAFIITVSAASLVYLEMRRNKTFD